MFRRPLLSQSTIAYRFGFKPGDLAYDTSWLWSAWWLPIAFAALYAFAFPIPFPLDGPYSTSRNSFAIITKHNPYVAIGLAVAGSALVILNRRMWKLARDEPSRFTLVLVLVGWLVASLLLLLAYPGQSCDLGDYSFRAHMLVHLGKNPMTTPPSAVIADAEYPQIGWFWEKDPYGPIWHGLAGITHLLADESFLANATAFRALSILATGLSGALIYSILRNSTPSYAPAGLALWLWNPLVLNEGALHGHNDLVLIAIVLMAIWLLMRKRMGLGLFALIAAGLVKVNAWIFVPVAMVWILRQLGWRQATRIIVPGLLGGAALVGLAYLPFGGVERLIELARERSWWSTSTWTGVVASFVRDQLHWSHGATITWILGGVTCLFVIISLTAMMKIRDLRLGLWAEALVYLLVGCFWFQVWYATWLIALTAIIVNDRLVSYASIFTCFMLLHPIVAQYVASQLGLPTAGYNLIMVTTTLLVPQIMAIRLMLKQEPKVAPSI